MAFVCRIILCYLLLFFILNDWEHQTWIETDFRMCSAKAWCWTLLVSCVLYSFQGYIVASPQNLNNNNSSFVTSPRSQYPQGTAFTVVPGMHNHWVSALSNWNNILVDKYISLHIHLIIKCHKAQDGCFLLVNLLKLQQVSRRCSRSLHRLNQCQVSSTGPKCS